MNSDMKDKIAEASDLTREALVELTDVFVAVLELDRNMGHWCDKLDNTRPNAFGCTDREAAHAELSEHVEHIRTELSHVCHSNQVARAILRDLWREMEKVRWGGPSEAGKVKP